MSINFNTIVREFVMKEPELGKMLLSCRIIEDPDPKTMPTMAVSITDRPNLYYNPDFVKKLTTKELHAIIIHEMYHLINLHPSRHKKRTAVFVNPETGDTVSVFNYAADTTINQYIEGLPPDTITLDSVRGMRPDLKTLDEKRYTEYYYDRLVQNVPSISMASMSTKGDSGYSPDDHLKGHSKWGESVDEDEARKVIQDTITKSDMDLDAVKDGLEDEVRKDYRHFGTGSRDINKRLHEQEALRKVNWHEVLRQIRNARTVRLKKPTIFRRNRRYNHLAGKAKIKKVVTDGKKHAKKLYVGVDVSGSISDSMAMTFFKNCELLLPFVDDVTIIQCSAHIHDVDNIKRNGKMMHPMDFVRKGNGGTSFRPVFDYIKKNENLEKGRHFLVYLTDLEGDFPQRDDGINTFWITPTENVSPYYKPPFGEIFRL